MTFLLIIPYVTLIYSNQHQIEKKKTDLSYPLRNLHLNLNVEQQIGYALGLSHFKLYF